MHRHHIQAVEQIFAETSAADFLAQVAGGGRHHPHINLDVLIAADAAKTLFHQHPQDAALSLARHVADLMQIEGAAVRLFEHADLARPAALAFLAEQLQVHAVRSHARRAYGHELPLGSGAGLVNQARHQLLTRSGRARDQDAAVGGSDLADQLAQLLGRAGAADKAIRHACLGPQAAIFALQ